MNSKNVAKGVGSFIGSVAMNSIFREEYRMNNVLFSSVSSARMNSGSCE